MNHHVLRLLQHVATYGLYTPEFRWGRVSGLPWYKRLVNWVCDVLDAPYMDPENYGKTHHISLTLREQEDLDQFLRLNAPKPKCKLCGSGYLEPDPAGYYEHATDYRGAPLLCPGCAGATAL